MMRVLVVVPVHNRADLLDRCLATIWVQDDPAFDVVIADDASTDPKVSEVMDAWCERARTEPTVGSWWAMHQSENVGATRNIVEAVRGVETDPDDVVLIVDGDDRLAHAHAVHEVRARFQNTANLVTFGSYEPDPPCETCPPARPIPEWVLRAGVIRAMSFHSEIPWNHPLAFRRRAFDALSDEDFMMDGEWMRYGYDVAFMAPLIELAGTRVEFISDALYVYTSDRPESVGRAYPEATAAEGRHVLDQPRKYEPLEW